MFLGIDIGTSAVKALVADENQHIIATAAVPLSISRPHDLWAEQDPEDWWRAVESAISILRASAGTSWSAIRSIGLSGQMHGAVLLDGSGTPLRPAILWNDGRSHREADELNQQVPAIGTVAGVPAMASFVAPKLMWLGQHEPEMLNGLEHILLPKDYVRLKLTGGYVTDMCDGSGSLFLDSASRCWSKDIAAACGVDMAMLPTALEGNAVSGRIRDAVAAAWGLDKNTIVATGTGDASAAAIGMGAISEGDTFVSLGTSAQYFVTRRNYRPAPEHLIHTFCFGLPDRWLQMAAILNGASCLAWAAALMGQDDIGNLLQSTEAAFAGPSPITFLPYLIGDRTPHNNPHAKGVLFGLSASTTQQQVCQAVLEGVVLSLADCQGYVAETGPLPDVIGVSGGGSKSRFWIRLLASALGRTVVQYRDGDTGPAFGAARLARLALTGEDPGAVCIKPEVAATIEPEPPLVDAYGARLEKFRSLYRVLAHQF